MKRQRRHILGLIFLLVMASMLTGSIASFILYTTAFRQKSEFLLTEVTNLARLIEAVAKFDRHTFVDVRKATKATLSQVEAAFKDQRGVGETGEILMGRREDKRIVIFLRYRDQRINENLILPFDQTRSEAMDLALQGKTGVGEFTDLTGERVLASYTYIPFLQTGLEIKVGMNELIRPYLYSGAVIALLSGIVILICVFFFIRITRPVLDEIRRLTHKVIEIKDEEQNKLSKEIHDTIGTNLVWLKLQTQQLYPQVNHELMQSFDDAIETTRNLSHGLSPVAIEKLGLGEMLERLVGRVEKIGQVAVHFDSQNAEIDFAPKGRFHIFRIIQEILNNALKHAAAKNIYIKCRTSRNRMFISVVDDGIGFNPEKRGAGIGLSLIAERVNLLKGNMNIKSAPQKGTEVTIDFPIA